MHCIRVVLGKDSFREVMSCVDAWALSWHDMEYATSNALEIPHE